MGDRSDLIVDYDVLWDSEKRLGKLEHEFKGMESREKHQRDIWGAGQVESAMGAFFNNWDHYRKELTKDVHEVRGKVTAARKAFKKADQPGSGGGKGGKKR